jgi:hypothetical protein
MIVSVAPKVAGSPTIVLPLPVSRALPVIFRLLGSLGCGFFTTIDLPRIAWSAANALPHTSAESASTITQYGRVLGMRGIPIVRTI